MASELVYIVIPVHSRGEFDIRQYFNVMMETLERYTTNFRLIFVDDYCDEAGSICIQSHASRFRESYIIKTEKQRWFTRASNLGLRLVRSHWAVLLNTDTELFEGWLEELFAVRDLANEELGIPVGLVGSEMSVEEPRRWQNITSPSTPGNPGYVTGHCWLLSMQALQQCSEEKGTPGWYLDETQQKTIHIFSDNELCYSMQRLGWATVRSFKSLVGHHGGKSWGHQNLGRVMSIPLAEVND